MNVQNDFTEKHEFQNDEIRRQQSNNEIITFILLLHLYLYIRVTNV